MTIDAAHPLYDAWIERWQRCRDAYDGEDAVKARGALYLPKIDPGQNADEYKSYLKRALYFEAVSRTVDGFVGAVARKPHQFTLPAALKPLEQDATGTGLALDALVKLLCHEALLTGRAGVLVDFDDVVGLPYVTVFPAEAIINWSPGRVVLSETVYEAQDGNTVEVQQLRELSVQDGRYTVTIWRKSRNPVAGWEADQTTPTRRGVPFNEIPFLWLTPSGQTATISKPPCLALVNVSLSHYRSSADLEHGRHFTALPTLYVTGVATDTEIRVGAAAVIQLQDPASKAGYAEFSGAGLGSLETALSTKEQQMAALGASIIAQAARRQVETASAAQLRSSAETSMLMGVIVAVETVLAEALKIAAHWLGVTDAVEVVLNRDLVDVDLDPQTLAALFAALQGGAISLETFLFCLQQGELLQPNLDIAAEAARLGAARKVAEAARVAASAQLVPARVASA